jgi:hypothetical protein
MENLNIIPGFNELFQKCHPELIPMPTSLPQTTVVTKPEGGSGFPFGKVMIGGIVILFFVYTVHKLIDMNEERWSNSVKSE